MSAVMKAVELPTTKSQWKNYLQEGHQDTVIAILEFGKRMYECQKTCPPKAGGSIFAKEVPKWLGISQSTASRWAQIGKAYPELTHIAGKLPLSYSAIHEIATMDPAWREKGISEGLICTDSTREKLVQFKHDCKMGEKTKVLKKKPDTEVTYKLKFTKVEFQEITRLLHPDKATSLKTAKANMDAALAILNAKKGGAA